jgi:hypothetical protein
MKGIQPEDSTNPPNVSDVFFGGDAPFLAQDLEELRTIANLNTIQYQAV